MLFLQQENTGRHDGQKSQMPILRKQTIVQIKNNINKSQGSMSEEISKETQETIGKLHTMEQHLQTILMQKQQFQTQLFEMENALKELETTETAYKIVGNIMVGANKKNLTEELSQKKELVEMRIKNLDKQEKQLKEKAESLQKEVLGAIKAQKE